MNPLIFSVPTTVAEAVEVRDAIAALLPEAFTLHTAVGAIGWVLESRRTSARSWAYFPVDGTTVQLSDGTAYKLTAKLTKWGMGWPDLLSETTGLPGSEDAVADVVEACEAAWEETGVVVEALLSAEGAVHEMATTDAGLRWEDEVDEMVHRTLVRLAAVTAPEDVRNDAVALFDDWKGTPAELIEAVTAAAV
jgi:hypothetical protein